MTARRRPSSCSRRASTRDLERGVTGAGPHLDDVLDRRRCRDLRNFGSQGEQRLAVLALLLAEAELIVERRGFRRSSCSTMSCRSSIRTAAASSPRGSRGGGQALITATDAAMLPAEPDQLVEVSAGVVSDAA